MKALLKSISYILLKLHRWVLRHPRSTLIAFILTLVLSVGLLPQLKMLLLIDDLIDPDFKTYQSLQALNQDFTDQNNIYVIVRPPEGGQMTKEILCDLQAWMQTLVLERRDLVKILSSFGVRQAQTIDNTLRFKPLLDLHCENRSDPETENVRSQLQQLSRSPWGAALTSLKSDDILISIFIANTLTNSPSGKFDTAIVEQLMLDFNQKMLKQHPGLRPQWAGTAAFQYYLKKGYDQTGLLNLLTVSLVFFIFRWLFGTWKSGFLFIFSYLFALIPTYGGMALFGHPIDVLTNALALMVLIASIEDFLFIASLYSKNSGAWRKPFRQILTPSFFTSLTTAIGFFSLMSADFGIIRRFGLWAGIAAMLEFLTVFLLLPALLQTFPKLQNFVTTGFARRTSWFENWKLRTLSKPLTALALVVFVFPFLTMDHLVVSDAPENVFSSSHPVRQTAEELMNSRGWKTEVSLVFKKYRDREFNEQVLTELQKNPLVTAIENPYTIVDYIKGDTSATLQRNLDALWSLTSVSKRLVNPNTEEARAVLYLNKTDIVDVNSLGDVVQKICQDRCELAGTLVSYGEFGERVLSTLLESLGLSLILIALILIFLLTALEQKRKWILIASALWGPLCLLTLFTAFRIPIFYVTSIFASILVGLSGDNTIQYIFWSKRQTVDQGVKSLGGASIVLTFVMCLLSCVLFGSLFGPMRILGLLMIIGFILTLFGDLWLLQGLSKLFPEQGILPDLIRKVLKKN